jgi:hypothetical protein
VIPLRSVCAAWKLSSDTLLLQLASGDEVQLSIPGEPNELLCTLGCDVDQRALAAPLRRGIGAFTMGFSTFWGTVFLALFLGAIWHSVWLMLAGFPFAAALTAFVVQRFGSPRLRVGADGVSVTGVLNARFIPYESIFLVSTSQEGITLRLRDDTAISFPMVAQPRDHVTALAERAHEGMRRYAATRSRPIAVLERAGRPIAEWCADVQRLVGGEGPFRTASIPRADLEATLADPNASTELRVGAAVALRALDPDDATRRIRVAAESSADERVRVALEAVGDEESLGRALERR